MRPRAHGWLRECLRYEADHNCVRVGIDTGQMRRSLRLGENCGINALTGEFTAWIPAPEEAEFEQEWPAKWEPKGLLEHHEDKE